MEDFSPFMGSIVALVIFQRSDLILTKFLKIMNWKSFEIWTRASIDSPRNRIIGGYISYIIYGIWYNYRFMYAFSEHVSKTELQK